METLETWVRKWAESDTAEAPVVLRGPVEADWRRLEGDVAGLMLCSGEGRDICGSCPDCKKVQARVHPDVVRLADSEKTLKVKQVREARQEWLTMPYGRRRLIIIPRAERLTLESANALLKELEEGTAHNRFLLWTPFVGRLPATIRSRSQSVRLPQEYTESKEDSQADWESIVNWKRKQPFSEEELGAIYQYLQRRARQVGVDAAWYRASLRLRDFYQVVSRQGNAKMATDVLLASLHELR